MSVVRNAKSCPAPGPLAAPGGLLAAAMLLAATAFGTASPAEAQTSYREPPPEIVEILDAPLAPFVSVAPDRRWLALSHRKNMPSIEEQSQPMLRLAGRRINPATNGSFGSSLITGISLLEIEGDERRVTLPDGGGWSTPAFAPDGSMISFERTTASGIELWLADVASARARPVRGAQLNGLWGRACDWLPDGGELLCLLVPGGRGAPPETPKSIIW